MSVWRANMFPNSLSFPLSLLGNFPLFEQRCITFYPAKALGNMSQEWYAGFKRKKKLYKDIYTYPGICIVNSRSDFRGEGNFSSCARVLYVFQFFFFTSIFGSFRFCYMLWLLGKKGGKGGEIQFSGWQKMMKVFLKLQPGNYLRRVFCFFFLHRLSLFSCVLNMKNSCL